MFQLLVLLFALVAPAQAQDPASLVGATAGAEAGWQATLERAIPAVVAIRVTGTRDFDTEDAGSSVGTGFVVDAERGLILTNRHMVHAGPVVAEAVFLDHEEVDLQAIYRDPVHDFGFYRFDPAALKHMDLVELRLAPEAAQVGRDIRVVGNDAGEKISILGGTLARLDRDAPDYGGNTYNDFNTFYLQAASGTSGGSSGSPVLDIDGRVIALNAGGRREAASSYYLPLDRVVRALELIQRGEPISRGTMQTVFTYLPYDEVGRLGLSEQSASAMREAFPQATGLLVVNEVVPGGPADGLLEPGDVLVTLDDQLINHFVPLEQVLDASVGGTVRLGIERGDQSVEVEIPVGDLHAITPDEFLDVGRAVLHPLSYQQARNHMIPVQGVYLAVPGYIFSRAGMQAGAILSAIDGEPVPDLDALQRILEARAHGQRMIVRYRTIFYPDRDFVAVVTMDRLWFPMQRCRRDDTTGLWPCTGAAPAPPLPETPPAEALPLVTHSKVGALLAPSLVAVEFDIPHPTAGVKDFNYLGNGLVIDAEKGWVLVDRDTVPVALGDIEIVVAGTLRVPGRLVYLHPVHNLAVIAYDPAHLGDVPVRAATFDPTPPEVGEKLWQVGLDTAFRLVANETKVEWRGPLGLDSAGTPRFHDTNIEGVTISPAQSALGGVLADKKGRVRAIWASFLDQRDAERTFYGLPLTFVPEWMLSGGDPSPYCAPGFQARKLRLVEGLDRGLSMDRVRALAAHDDEERSIFEIEQVMGGSVADQGGLRTGDLLVAARVGGEVRLVTRLAELEALARDLCPTEDGAVGGELIVLRDGAEQSLPFGATVLDGHGVDRAVAWAGLIAHAPHLEVASQQGIEPEGVYISWLWYGSPAARYGLRPTRRIVEVDGVPTPDLDAFLAVVSTETDRKALRVKMLTLDGHVQVNTLKLDPHYWPLSVLERGEDGSWTRR